MCDTQADKYVHCTSRYCMSHLSLCS